MFDYIISSLVFDKYGNIYGFLADTIRQTKSLSFDSILRRIKENLKNATFANEYGSSSSLTELSVNRIFHDMILPLFPKVATHIDILSLDYIFAQAGSAFLRIGRLNETYYSNFKNYTPNNEDLFEEYFLIGNILENLLHHKTIDPLAFKCFALPALFFYVSTEDELQHETITNIIFNPHHWKRAYDKFSQYILNAFTQINEQLKKDYKFEIHKTFSNFHSRAAFAKLVLNLKCKLWHEHTRETKIPVYLYYAEHYECRLGDVLPNINEWFQNQIHESGEVYEKYDLEMTQQFFNESLIGDLLGVVIKLVLTNDKVVANSSFNNSQHLPYDLLEWFYTENQTSYYYALIRENYTISLIKEADDPELFRQIIGPSLDNFILSAERIVLKYANESTKQLSEELMKYKKDRFKSYLKYSENNLNHTEWWKEFGLSLVPFYPCLSKIPYNYWEINKYLCERENIKFLNNFQEDVSSHLMNRNTQTLLSSFGINLKTIFINDIIDGNLIYLLESAENISIHSLKFDTPLNKLYEEFALHIEEPQFENACITPDGINFTRIVIDFFERHTNQLLKYARNMLNRMEILKSRYSIKVGNVSGMRNYSLLVNSWNRDTGYGYKFIPITNKANNQTVIAELRTDYEFKDKIFISLLQELSKNERIYRKYNSEIFGNKDQVIFYAPVQNTSEIKEVLLKYENGTLVPVTEVDNLIFEINNHLRRKSVKISFYGISVHKHEDDACIHDHYLKKWNKTGICIRHWRFIEKIESDRKILRDLMKNKKDENFVIEKQIRAMMKIHTFPNDSTTKYFFNNWLRDAEFKNSDWMEKTVVDTSGLLNILLYNVRLDNGFISILEAEERINSTHSYRERSTIEEERSLENITEDYNNQKAFYTLSFQDYYAIRNFATTGYKRITRDTTEAKLMKLGLYRLAIRQFEYENEEFDLKLYCFDTMPEDMFQRQFIKDSIDVHFGKSIILQKFTLTSTHEESALRFAGHPAFGFRNVLYEIKFYGPYLRAKIDVEVKKSMSETFREKRIILLPGSEFFIERISIAPTESIGKYFKVELASKSKNSDKYEMYKNIMKQIAYL